MGNKQADEKKMVGVRFKKGEHRALKKAANTARMSMGGFCAVATLEKMAKIAKMAKMGYRGEY